VKSINVNINAMNVFCAFPVVQQILTKLSGTATEKEKVACITKAVFRMSTTVHRTLNIIALSADGIRRQAYKVRKHLHDIKQTQP
jgi:hypothetical protein